jgi:putative ABC transport system permease protein
VQDYPDLLPTEPGEWPGYTLMVMAPYEVKPQFDALDATVRPTKLGMTFKSENPGQSTAEMQTMIDGASVTADYNLYNVYEILEQNPYSRSLVSLFSVVFVTMISLIAAANVFNTISTNITLRRRELAMLRSVGMSNRDFNKMMRFECALYGARTIALGAAPFRNHFLSDL